VRIVRRHCDARVHGNPALAQRLLETRGAPGSRQRSLRESGRFAEAVRIEEVDDEKNALVVHACTGSVLGSDVCKIERTDDV
jgi:hypothetical protein